MAAHNTDTRIGPAASASMVGEREFLLSVGAVMPIQTTVLGPTRPDRLTIWPADTGEFGIDVRWGGRQGNSRATVVRHLLTDAGVKARLAQSTDGAAWELRVGPVPGTEVAKVIDTFIW